MYTVVESALNSIICLKLNIEYYKLNKWLSKTVFYIYIINKNKSWDVEELTFLESEVKILLGK